MPVTIVESTKIGEPNYCADLVDIMCLNRYFGWYDELGNIGAIAPLWLDELGKLHDK